MGSNGYHGSESPPPPRPICASLNGTRVGDAPLPTTMTHQVTIWRREANLSRAQPRIIPSTSARLGSARLGLGKSRTSPRHTEVAFTTWAIPCHCLQMVMANEATPRLATPVSCQSHTSLYSCHATLGMLH